MVNSGLGRARSDGSEVNFTLLRNPMPQCGPWQGIGDRDLHNVPRQHVRYGSRVASWTRIVRTPKSHECYTSHCVLRKCSTGLDATAGFALALQVILPVAPEVLKRLPFEDYTFPKHIFVGVRHVCEAGDVDAVALRLKDFFVIVESPLFLAFLLQTSIPIGLSVFGTMLELENFRLTPRGRDEGSLVCKAEKYT